MSYRSSPKNKKIIKAVMLLLIFYILPPLAILLGFIPFQYRFPLLILVVPIMMLIKPDIDNNPTDFGITKSRIRESVLNIIPITILLVLPLLIVAITAAKPRIDNSSLTLVFYMFYVFISCPFQEFVYRGYLFQVMKLLNFSKLSKILIGAILYSFLHIIYLDIWTLIFTLFAGVLWNINYDKFKNLTSVTLSHIVLGTTTIFLGLI